MKQLYFLFLLCLAHLSNGANITGKIIDLTTNLPVSNAVVIVHHTKHKTVSDSLGNFYLNNIPAGHYTITAFHIGYKKSDQNIAISENETSVLNFNLAIDERANTAIQIKAKLNKESDVSARTTEKTAENVVNVVSAQTIEKSADITVAQVAQRVSGITLDRSTDSQRQYAIIRGIEQRYNNTLINGVKIPSPDPENRFVPLDIIPADLLQRMIVTKALTPNMEGDAIGGTINAVMKDAPDSTIFVVNTSTGYNQIFLTRKFITFNKNAINTLDPDQSHGHYYAASQKDFSIDNLKFRSIQPLPNSMLGVTYGRRFLNKRLGVILSVSDQNSYSGSQSVYNITYTDIHNNPQVTDILKRSYSTYQTRLGINSKLDYIINDKNRISLYNLYLSTHDIQSREIDDTLAQGNGRYGPGTGYVSVAQRSRFSIQTIENATLQGKHEILKNLQFDWSGVYSIATGRVPDMAELNTYHTVVPGGAYLNNAEYLGTISHTWQKNIDHDVAVYLNFDYKVKILNKNFNFKAGGLHRYKYRNNYQNDYSLKPVLNSSNQDPPYTGIDSAKVYPYQPVGNPEYNVSNYTATESIGGYYIQGKTNIGLLQVLTGVRLETTSQSNRNKIVLYPGYTQHFFDYSDVLPSVHFTYKYGNKQNFRFSVFKSISRPNYYELVDYVIKGDQVNQAGNPNLKHAKAWNFDLRYELYPNNEDVVMAGIFYKKIIDPIERVLKTNGGQPVITFGNFGTATIYGFEFVYIKYIGIFGISANYTFIHSQISSPKILYEKSPNTGADTVITVLEQRPLQGQSKHIANVSLMIRNQKKGFNMQLAFLFQGKRINQVSYNYGLDYYQSNYPYLSFSIEKNLLKKITVFAKVNNIANTPYQLKTKTNIFIQKDTYMQTYQIGLRYRL